MTHVVQPLHRSMIPNGYSLGKFRELAKSKIIDEPKTTRTIIRDAQALPDQPGKLELVEKLKKIHRMRSTVPEDAWFRFIHRALRRAGSSFEPFDKFRW